MHPMMDDYLNSLALDGKPNTAACYRHGLRNYSAWLARGSCDPLRIEANQVKDFQRWLAEEYRTPAGQPLGKGTQGTRLSAVKGFYGWLYRRGVLLADPSVALTLPKVRRTTVACDYLSQQEVAAMLQTQAQTVVGRQEGSQGWAIEHRNLALLCLAIATGRRRASLVSLKVKDVDFERNEVRVAYEKGKPGRVLPCADWAAQVVLQYVQQARPLLLGKRNDEGFLFVALARAHVCDWYPGRLLKRLQQRTALHNPDLTGLADKSLSAHSLRTTFATLLFFNGANIRTVNELLLHTSLSTTAKYTPLGVDDLRRTFRLAHPRA